MRFLKRNKDYVFTFLTEIIVLASGVLVYKFAAQLSGGNDFSEYALIRRSISFIMPLFIMGLGVGIPRYLAFSTGNKTMQDAVLIAGFLLVLTFTLPGLLIIFIWKDFFATLFFSSVNYSYLIAPLLLMVFGMILHGLNYAYYRGVLKMLNANFFQLINLGVVPIIVFAFYTDLLSVIWVTGLLWTAISLVVTGINFWRVKIHRQHIVSKTKEMFAYGLQRVPGDFGLAGFLAIPAFFTAHIVDDELVMAGYVAFAISLFNMAGAAFGPICLILLPESSVLIKNKQFALLKQKVKKLAVWTLLLTVLGVLIVELFANELMLIYLGNTFNSSLIACIRITMLACLGYTLYISLRSILDAYYVKAVNTKNILLCLILFLGCSVAGYFFLPESVIVILYSFVIAMSVLGVLTYVETRKMFLKHQV